jgi:hypothetical protein
MVPFMVCAKRSVAARPQSNRNRDGEGLSNVEDAFWQPLLAATASTFVAMMI